MNTTEKSRTGWYFLGIVLALYAATAIYSTTIFMRSIAYFWSIIQKILPVLALVFALLAATNLWVKPKSIVKHMGKDAGLKGWVWAVLGGIISTGPIYIWYPFLNEMQKHGARDKYITAFLYNRAIKPALLPLFIYYFGIAYTTTLLFLMIIASIIQGISVEKIMEATK